MSESSLSKKSVFVSPVKLKRLFKYRPVTVRQFDESDLSAMWAAYQLDGFELPKDLSQKDFEKTFYHYAQAWEFHWVAVTSSVTTWFFGNPEARGVKLNMIHMPWASSRNILEGVAMFAREVKDKAVFWGPTPPGKFFTLLSKYGLVRRIGKIEGYYDDSDAILFQTSVKKHG